MHRRSPKLAQWEIPGGKIEPGENARTTAVREVEEELGITVKIVRDLGGHTFVHDGADMYYTWLLAEILSGTPAPLEDKFADIGYFSWDELKAMPNLSANTRNLVSAHPAGLRYHHIDH